MAEHNKLGRWGEKVAYDFLVARGYAILKTNWRMGHYEVDIIAMKDDRIVFMEVKTRTNDYVDPLDSIDRRRIRHLVAAANVFIQTYDIPHQVQFDVLTIIGSEASAIPPVIEHYPDAFFAPLR